MNSLLDLHLDQVPEPEVVPGGDEYQLRITSAQQQPSKSSDRELIKVSLEIADHPTAKPIFENFSLPMEGDPDKNVYFFSMQLKRFCQAFGLDLSDPGDPAEWVGLEGWGILREEKDQNGEPVNSVARWVQQA